jgi:integrase
MRLTDQTAAGLKIENGKSEARAWDAKIPGFGVRLRLSGSRTWIFQYRVGAQQRCIKIGAVSAVRAVKAREEAEKLYARSKLGGDPQAEKAAAARAGKKLAPLFEEYIVAVQAKVSAGTVSASTLGDTARYLREHFKPLGRLPIETATRAEIAQRLTKISAECGPIAANRARATLSSFFTWAMKTGRAAALQANPVTFTAKNDEHRRDRVLSDAELVAVWNACEDDDYGRIVRLLILTGQRRGEVGGMMRAELNDLQNFWLIPRDRTKNGLPHEVSLSTVAADIVRSARKRVERDLLFGDGSGPFSGWSKARAALDKRIEKAAGTALEPWVIHDLRRTVATGMGELGVQPHIVEAVLNHISGHKAGVAGIYNHATYRAEKRQALERWAAHVTALISGKLENIVALKRA